MLEALLERFRQHDRLALSRLVSLLARGEQGSAILERLPTPTKPARVIAVTGSAGVGKSTLVGKLIEQIRDAGLTVAVLACDPQSPLTGGALLGDRFRMPARPEDDGVFIRSLSAIGGHGAVADHLDALVRLLEAFGFDIVLVETVGAGQGDTVVRSLGDAVVVLLQPETGDDLQWEKAGLLEVADVIVIHKADLPGAERVEAQVLATLGLAGGPAVPVLRVSSRTGAGLEELWKAIEVLPLRRHEQRDVPALIHAAQEKVGERLQSLCAADNPGFRTTLDRWQRGELTTLAAVGEVLRLATESGTD